MNAKPRPDRRLTVGGDIRDSLVVVGDGTVLDVAVGDDAILRRRLAERLGELQRRRHRVPPPPPRDRVGREAELAAVAATPGHVNLHGPSGIGKTYVLLAALGTDAVWVDAARRPLDDVLHALAEELLELPPGVILTPARRRRELGDIAATVAIDDVELDPQDGRCLVAEAPHCRFLLGSRRPALTQARGLRIAGLPPASGRALLVTALGRGLGVREVAAAEVIVDRLAGHPLMLIQAAGLSVDTGIGLADLARSLSAGDPASALGARLLAALTPADRAVLDALARVGGAPAGAGILAAIGAPPDAADRLAALESRGLVQSHGGRYTRIGALAGAEPRDAIRLADALADWAERSEPAAVLEEWAALLAALRRAQTGAGEGARGEAKREDAVVRLGRALSHPLAVGRRWGAWAEVLAAVRDAGGAEDRAWALHQLGTRAFALGDAAAALEQLELALALRQRLGDQGGAATTRHNLEFIRDGASPPADERAPERPGRRWGARALAGSAVALVAAIAIAAIADHGDPPRGDPVLGDSHAPVVTITSPEQDATFSIGQTVRAHFTCRDDQRLATCAGRVGGRAVDDGDALPAEAGSHRLTVTATDAMGNDAAASVRYEVVP